MAAINGLRERLLVVLAAFALLPVVVLGLIALMEMNQASDNVKDNIVSLSTSLNRSALLVGPNDADQVQLAIAKARQYDEFFKCIALDNELVARYAQISSADESCLSTPGIWVAPTGSNRTISLKRESTIRSLCAPAGIMQALHEAGSSFYISYIGTEDGVLAVWPYDNKTLSNTAPFGYKDMPYYSRAKQKKGSIWTAPFADTKGNPSITIATPIYRGDEFTGIVGMDVSLYPIYNDLASIRGRGYPFIIDSSGQIVFRSSHKNEGSINDLFEADNLSESDNPQIRALARSILKERSGSVVIGLGGGDGYVAFSRISSLGWTFCIVYPAEEMSLPARFIDSGIRLVAENATQGLSDASQKVRQYIIAIFFLALLSVIGTGWWLSSRIEGQILSLANAAENISRGEFDARVSASGELAILETSFNKMMQGLKQYVAGREAEAFLRGGSGKETAFIDAVKRNLVSVDIPEEEEYEVCTLYWPSATNTTDNSLAMNSFDLYDIARSGHKIAFAMAGVGGEGIHAAMLAIMSRTLIRSLRGELDPAKATRALNSQINQHGHGTNLACFYALLDPVNHTLEYVNAGFNPPFIVDLGGMVDTLGGGGIALGMLEQIELEKTVIPIQPGDVMVMYSNGVVEAVDGSKRQFGIERLINLVIANRDRPCTEIIKSAEKELIECSGSMPASLDISLIILKRI